MEIIDHRLIGALHLLVLDHEAAQSPPTGADDVDDDAAFQTSSIEALLDGRYEGDLTVAELLVHGDLGIGTVDHLDGELVIIDGEALVVSGDGTVRAVPSDEPTPFAVVCRFRPDIAGDLGACPDFGALTAAVDQLAPDLAQVAAVRVDGTFSTARVRSVARQEPPYVSLREVVGHQSEWQLHDVTGSLVGFRFPEVTDGLEVAGWHLHLISDDRTRGGHVIDVALTGGRVRVESITELHVELPDAVDLPDLGIDAARAAAIRAVEGR